MHLTLTTAFILVATVLFGWLAAIWSTGGRQSLFKVIFAAMAIFGIVLFLAAIGFVVGPNLRL